MEIEQDSKQLKKNKKTQQTRKTKQDQQKQKKLKKENPIEQEQEQEQEEEKIEIQEIKQQPKTRAQRNKEKQIQQQNKKKVNYCELSDEDDFLNQDEDDLEMENEDEEEEKYKPKKKPNKKQQKQAQKALKPVQKTQKPVKKQQKPAKILDFKQARVERAKKERIFLMRAERANQNEWNFTVQGQSGNNYLVTASRDKLKCRCMDCAIRRRTCKHLLFIVAKIAMSDKLLNSMTTNLQLNDKQYDQLDMALIQRLQKRLDGQKRQKKDQKGAEKKDGKDQIDLGDDTDCPICFDDMRDEELDQCKNGCKKYIHQVCIEAWLKKNQNCPLCRADWYQQEDSDDEFEDKIADKKNRYGGRAMQKLAYRNINLQDDESEEEDDDEEPYDL